MPYFVGKNFKNNYFGPPAPIDPVPPGPEWTDISLRESAEVPSDILRINSGFIGGPHNPELKDVFPDRIWTKSFAETPGDLLRTRTAFWPAKPDYVEPPTPPVVTDFVDRSLVSFALMSPDMVRGVNTRIIKAPTYTGVGPEPLALVGLIYDGIGVEPKYKVTSRRIEPKYKAKGGTV